MCERHAVPAAAWLVGMALIVLENTFVTFPKLFDLLVFLCVKYP